MQSLSPFLRSPMTDITGGLASHQLFGKCADFEMEAMDCLEAYGLDRGVKRCKHLIEDFRECHTKTKQFSRFCAMRDERDAQIASGKLKCEKRYEPIEADSF